MEGILQLIGSIQDKQSVSQGVQNAQADSIGSIDDTIAPLLLIEPGSTTSTQFLNKDGTFKEIQDASTSAPGIIRLIDEDDMTSNVVDRVPTQQSVKAYVTSQIDNLIAGAPSTLNDLNELAAALNDNPDLHQLVTANQTKLAGIEAGATADQTAAEIRTLVESASDSNVFTDADHSKLDGIEAGATADQTAAEIRTLVESASDSNVFTDADHSKLDGIEAGATADQTADDIKTLLASSKLTSDHVNTMGSANSYAAGLVLAGNATHNDEFLRKDGTWASAGGGSWDTLPLTIFLQDRSGGYGWEYGALYGKKHPSQNSVDTSFQGGRYVISTGFESTTSDFFQFFQAGSDRSTARMFLRSTNKDGKYLQLRMIGASSSQAYLETDTISPSLITTAGGNYSDDRLKFNERELENAESILKKVPIRRYMKTQIAMTKEEEDIFESGGDGFAKRKEGRKDNQKMPEDTLFEEVGVVAQDCYNVDDVKFMVANNGEGLWQFRYDSLTCINTRVLQRLLERVEALEAKG
jgi:hypothetical protein